jgi:DNA-binding GntR family transcriptional regulator
MRIVSPETATRLLGDDRLSKRASVVYRALKSDLITGRIRPGGFLHEVAIAERFRVSKSPVRDALSVLRAEGYVDVVPRRGYIATQVSLREVHEVFALRALLEGEAAALAAGRDGPALAARLASLAAGARAAKADDRPEAYVEMNRRFHLAIAEAAGHSLLARWIEHLLERAERIIWLGVSRRVTSDDVYHETDELIDAIRGGEAEEARRAMTRHIENMRRRLLTTGMDPLS